MNSVMEYNRRVLIVDDQHSIHHDLRQILSTAIEIDSAFQRDEGVEQVRQSVFERRPYGMAFVGRRMASAIDFVEMISEIWQIDPQLNIVIYAVKTDGLWEEKVAGLGRAERILILKKPFDAIEIRQLVNSLLERSRLDQQAEQQIRDLAREANHTRAIIDTANDAFVGIDQSGRVTDWSRRSEVLFGWTREEASGRELASILPPRPDNPKNNELQKLIEAAAEGRRIEMIARHRDGNEFPVELSLSAVPIDGTMTFNAFVHDITHRRKLQAQLAHAQKMESIGQLAAGIAHEINTPTQYVSDNARFLKDAFAELCDVLNGFSELLKAAKSNSIEKRLVDQIESAMKRTDVGYLTEDIPKAIDETLEGVDRVKTIVRAMKEFSHPGTSEKSRADLHEAIENTITVARNEWKYVADVTTEFEPDLPPVPCLLGDIKQVILNLVVNAAHAISESNPDAQQDKGAIAVRTELDGDFVKLCVTDTGCGIQPEYVQKIFDPFFTTKDVGKGTGQGLSIVHSVVVDGHDGTIDVESQVGVGTTISIRLPLEIETSDGLAFVT